jgi:Purple acid Phosphatase, N-terminal domain/Calcineurin-like phosphoesterase
MLRAPRCRARRAAWLAIATATLAAVLAEPAMGADYELAVSASPDRSSARPLEGATVAGKIYAFVRPEAGVTQARFFLDNPLMIGLPRQVENSPPWDFAGGTSGGSAKPFDTTSLPDGTHTITVALDLSGGGTVIVTAGFTARNTAASTLEFSRAAVPFAAAAGDTPISKTVRLRALDGAGVDATLTDDAGWLSVVPATARTDADVVLTANAAGLAPGTYRATVTASASGYASDTLPVTLTKRQSLEPDQVHLAWVADTSTTMDVIWRTWDTDTVSTVRYRPTGTTDWKQQTGGLRPSGTSGTLHEVALSGLQPDTAYEYAVRGDNGRWGAVYSTRTGPPPGPADFDAVYVADTGLIGRADGLATGTEQVRDEIAAMDPLLVLLGGDYAYYDTDKRYGTLDGTIDAWFNQMQPIASAAPMQVAYGNHEILLGEGYQPWAARFATPSGFDGRRNHSFDVGDVHFVSIFAVNETSGLPSATLSWIEQDMAAARARGQRWIVPFFHVSPFSDGTSHPSNLQLRAQLGPLFERAGVKVAISSHDQNYERTFPLVDVPTSNRPTSTSRTCYTSADGVSWVKVSPGGKLSNKNRNFSGFRTVPPAAYTAVRDNTMHHFARLTVTAGGTLRVRVYGVTGDGTPPIVQDDFQYTLGACPPDLGFDPASVTASAQRGGAALTRTVRLGASDGSARSAAVVDDAAWLTAAPSSPTLPGDITLTIDPAGLAPGIHRATVHASAAGARSATLPVTLTVTEPHELRTSTASDRSAAAPLQDQILRGTNYVFVAPQTGATQVRFYLDDPSMVNAPRKVEKNAPWDFAGTAADGSALGLDTTRLADGTHTITAAVDLAGGGTRVLTATFTIDN